MNFNNQPHSITPTELQIEMYNFDRLLLFLTDTLLGLCDSGGISLWASGGWARRQLRYRGKEKPGRTSKHARCLERTLQVTLCLLSENVDLDRLGVIEIFDTHESLNEQGLGKVEVDVHDGHHGDTHVCRTELLKERMRYEEHTKKSNARASKFRRGHSPER